MKELYKIIILVSAWLAMVACDEQALETPKSSGTSQSGSVAALIDSTVLSGWCSSAGSTQAATKLSAQFKYLCSGEKPTKYFSEAFANVYAYNGSNTPKVHALTPMSANGNRSEVTFAVAIELPIDVGVFFNSVAAKEADPATIQAEAQAQGATVEASVKQTYQNEGNMHVRGWDLYQKMTKTVASTQVVLEYTSRLDQYKLSEKAYLLSQYLKTEETHNGMFAFDQLSAAIQGQGKAYIFTVAHIIIDNKGFPEQAKAEVQKTAEQIIKAAYDQSRNAAGGGSSGGSTFNENSF